MLSDPNDAPRRKLRSTTLVLATVLAVALIVSLGVTVTAHGWHWTSAAQWPAFAFWRVPRTIASLGAGVMVALAGAMLQRMTGNPMASPELLGVSGGAMLGMLGAALAVSAPSAPLLLLSACAGALMVDSPLSSSERGVSSQAARRSSGRTKRSRGTSSNAARWRGSSGPSSRSSFSARCARAARSGPGGRRRQSHAGAETG